MGVAGLDWRVCFKSRVLNCARTIVAALSCHIQVYSDNSLVMGIRTLVIEGALHSNAITRCGDGFGVTDRGSICT